MGRDLERGERDTLESLIDAAGLCAVLQALSEICGEKADHIRASYSDAVTARAWDSACGVVGVASADPHVMAIGEP